MKKIFLSKISFMVSLLFTLTLILPSGNSINVLAATSSSTSRNQLVTNNTLLPPSNLAASLPSPNSVKLTWSSVYGATGYNIYQITEGQLNLISKTTSTNYSINSLSEGSYSYVVSTLSSDGESGPCAPVSVNIVYPNMTAPTTLTNTIRNGNDIVLNWTSTSYAQSYNIYSIGENDEKTLLMSTPSQTYTITNAPEGTYKYAVSAVNSVYGESSISTPLQVDVAFPKINAPANLIYRINNGSNVLLNWSSVSYANSYEVYELIDGQEILKSTVTTTTATLSNEKVGNHEYVVYAVNTHFGKSAGSKLSAVVSAQTMQAPTNFTYTISNSTNIALRWSSVTYATGYNIYQVSNGNKVLVSQVPGTSVSYTNLPAGDYVYEIHSYSDIFGESPEGSQVTTSLGVKMQAPSNLAHKINNGNDIILTWDSIPNATQYKVYIIKNGTKTLQSTITSTTITYSNMVAGDYSYEVDSYSPSYGESPEGSQISFTLAYPKMQAPENLKQTLVNATSFTLNWDPVDYATSYKVYQIVNGTKILKNTLSGTSTAFTNIAPGDYSYEVHSYSNKFGESTEGSSITFTLAGEEVKAPTNLTYSIDNINNVTLKWTAATYATCYNVYQVVNGEKNLVKMVTGTSVTFTNMLEGDYNYIVTSVSGLLGESPSGSEVNFSIDYPTIAPPSNLTYTTRNGNSVALSWTAANYATSYNVYELVDGQEVLKATVSSVYTTLTNVTPGNHIYVVHSVSNRFGESKTGSQISTNLAETIMSPPDNLTYNITNRNDITLKWSPSTYATSYNIYQIVDGQRTLIKTVTGTYVIFTNMPAGNYDYMVTAVSTAFGESPSASEISFDLQQTIMESPANPAYSITNGNDITLKWSPSTYATSYNIYQIVDGQKNLIKTVNGTSITFANMAAADYDYIITSVSTRFGEAPSGSEISFNLPKVIMESPTNLAYSITNGNDITLKWSPSTYATSYNIYQVVDGQKNLVKTVTSTSVTFANMPATDYHYIVTSVSTRFGEAPNGSEISFNLPQVIMQAPENLAYNITNGNDITLKWSPSTYAASYNIYQVVNGQKNLVKTVTSTSVTFTNMPATDYNYIITSVGPRFGEAPVGSEISFNLPQVIMQAPQNLAYNITNGNDITLRWSPSTYATSYNIYQVVDGQKNLVKTLTSTSVTFTNMPATDYNYVVTSVGPRFGEAPVGNEISFNLPQVTMQSPQNLAYNITNGNDITLRWSPSTYATSYNIYQVVDGQKNLVKTLTNTSVTFTNMPATDYDYIVTSVSTRFGESNEGSHATFTLNWPVVQAPILKDTITNINNINLSWQPVTWANKYRVYEVVGDTRNLLYEGTGLSYQMYNISQDTHNYEVTAYNTRFGESTPSNRITETIVFPPMNAPIANIRLLDKTSALIYWNFVNYANGYNVYEIVNGTPVLLTKNLNNLSYKLTNLSYKDHEYYVTSVSNSFGESEKSNTVIAKLIVDTKAPTTVCDAPENWINKTPLVVNLSSTDDITGVEKTYYSINDSDFVEGTSIVINKEGVNKISFYSVDKVGNRELTKTTYVKVDKTAPVTTSNVSEGWTKDDVTVNLTATDNGSGVAKTFYSIDGSEYTEGTSFS
ncbi:hypothetical protein NNC19_09155, partial [Clostridium sp. SHJSY1]|uniref:OmpL47-type beta-barrel domain-containing protein n=1 Tax=Clostridium sp. SHJSY1 TaxID=2942483 RepID=UPI002875B6B1